MFNSKSILWLVLFCVYLNKGVSVESLNNVFLDQIVVDSTFSGTYAPGPGLAVLSSGRMNLFPRENAGDFFLNKFTLLTS